jgi:type I site-specific restriction endonuclease
MVNLNIEETSGVDYPAHLHDGWLVMKAANPSDVQTVLESSVSKEDSVSESIENRLEEALELLTKAEERIAELEEATEEVAEETEAPAEEAPVEEEDVMKSLPEPVQKAFESLRKQAEEAQAKADEATTVLHKEREAHADAEAIEKARGWSHLSLDAQEVGPALRRLAQIDESLAKSVTEVLESVNAQAESADIFAEIGRTTGISGNAFSQLESMAKSAVSEGKASTVEQALADLAVAEPSLYAQYLNEKGA